MVAYLSSYGIIFLHFTNWPCMATNKSFFQYAILCVLWISLLYIDLCARSYRRCSHFNTSSYSNTTQSWCERSSVTPKLNGLCPVTILYPQHDYAQAWLSFVFGLRTKCGRYVKRPWTRLLLSAAGQTVVQYCSNTSWTLQPVLT